MNLVDKLGTKIAVGIGLVAGVMPQQVCGDPAGGMNYLAEQARKRGHFYEARNHADGAVMKAREEGERKAQETRRKVKETAQDKERSNEALRKQMDIPLLRPNEDSINMRIIICNNYDEQQGIRKDRIAKFFLGKDKEIGFVMETKSPHAYQTSIIIMDENENVLDQETWTGKPTKPGKHHAHGLGYDISEFRKGSFLIDFIAKTKYRTIKETKFIIIDW